MLQPSKLAFHGSAASVEVADALRVARGCGGTVAHQAQSAGLLLALGAAERDDRLAAAFLNLTVDAGVVVALVAGDRLRLSATSADASSSRATKLDSCRRAVSTCHASGRPVAVQTARCQLAAVEATTLAGADGGAVAPRRIGIAKPLAFLPSLRDVG